MRIPFIVQLLCASFALWITVLLIPGVSFTRNSTALCQFGIIITVTIILNIVNTFIKPFIQIFAFPLSVITFGLFNIIINATMLWIATWITRHILHQGLKIDHFWWDAIWVSIISPMINWALESVLIGFIM